MFKSILTRNLLYKRGIVSQRYSQQTGHKDDDDAPLAGLKVLDLTRIIAGPYCTMILGDLGAEIFKIERPVHGDECRKWGPPFMTNSSDSWYFSCVNRNKKSVAIDITSPWGQEVIHDMAKKCDVFIENYVPGKLDSYQLGYEHLKKINPGLIYCSITGFGSKGPYKYKPGYDVIASSLGGLLHVTGPEKGEPVKVGVAIIDVCTGLYAHGAIMAALVKRNRTNRGQKIDCDLLSTQLSTLINVGVNYLNAGLEGKRLGTAHASIVPYEAFPTKDGFFTIGCASQKQFDDFCQRINRPDIAQDEKYSTNSLRVTNRTILIPLLREILSKFTNQQLIELFDGASFPCGPINSIQQAFEDPHVKAIEIVKDLLHPAAGLIRLVGPPVEFSEGGNCIRAPPPILGQHTIDVMTNFLQYDREKIKNLINLSVLQ